MPRFYFDITDTGRIEVDEKGLECADLAAARKEALATLGEIARDELPDGDRRDFVITIRDHRKSPMLTAELLLRVHRSP
jgi:hypothetical protein